MRTHPFLNKSIRKRAVSLLLAVFMLAAFAPAVLAAPAVASGSCGSYATWTLYGDGVLIIGGSGEMTDYYEEDGIPWNALRSDITSVVVSDGVTRIGSFAFAHCGALASVTIPNSVTSIGNWAFAYCGSLTDVTLPSGLTSVAGWTFFHCGGLTSVTLPDGLTSIEAYAFAHCGALTSLGTYAFIHGEAAGIPAHIGGDETEPSGGDHGGVTGASIPSGVTSIGESAFYNCGSLSSVAIPDSVAFIGGDAFTWCGSLTRFIVGAGNAVYTAWGGVLFTKDMTMLLWYPAGRAGAYVIPDGVTAVSNRAFQNARLTSVVIPEGVTTIEDCTFQLCGALTSVTIPVSVTAIGRYAFFGCDELAEVHYAGTSEQWDEILIKTGNEPLTNAANGPIEITGQPTDARAASAGETVAFEVTATGEGLTYQWQYKDPGGAWTDWTDKTKSRMTCVATAARNGRQVRCVIKDESGNTATSEAATIIIDGMPVITAQPADARTVSVNQTVAFEATATGEGLTYQWQYRDPGGVWTDWTDKTKSRMTCVATAARNGRQVRCVITDESGNTVKSSAAFVLIEGTLVIKTQPTDVNTPVNQTVAFEVAAAGDGLTYQWQYRDQGGEWTNWAGKTKSRMTCVAVAARNGRQVRCVITDSSSHTETSAAATLTIA